MRVKVSIEGVEQCRRGLDHGFFCHSAPRIPVHLCFRNFSAHTRWPLTGRAAAMPATATYGVADAVPRGSVKSYHASVVSGNHTMDVCHNIRNPNVKFCHDFKHFLSMSIADNAVWHGTAGEGETHALNRSPSARPGRQRRPTPSARQIANAVVQHRLH
jgi:hypothetical protein